MEQIVQITELPQGSALVALTNVGNLYRFTPGTGGQGAWVKLQLMPDFDQVIEPLDHGGRLQKDYQLKKHRNQLFFWERISDGFRSGFFERQEAAVADARTDYMLRHKPKPPLPTP